MTGTQLSLFGKTSPEPLAAETKKTLGRSCKRSAPSPVIPYLYLDRRANGLTQARSWETVTPSPGGSMTLNTGECPSVAVVSTLSQILEDNVRPKYYLSARACRGVIARAQRRGKPLPELLMAALQYQIHWMTQVAACRQSPSKSGEGVTEEAKGA